jgi:O-antigen/teichoic acid export membrane protein
MQGLRVSLGSIACLCRRTTRGNAVHVRAVRSNSLLNRTKIAIGGILLLLLAQAWSWGLSLIEVTFVPRYLGPANIGKLSLAFSVLSVASVMVTFGGSTQIIRTIAAGREAVARFFTAVLVFRTAVGVPIILALCLMTYLLVEERLVVVLTAMTGLNTFLTWMLEALFAYRQAQASFTTYARAEMSAQTVSVFAKVLLVARGYGPIGAALGEMLRSIVGLISAWFSRAGRVCLARIQMDDLRQLVRSGLPYFQYNICVWLYATPTTTYMLCGWAGYETNGWFAIAQKLLGLLFVLPSATVSVLMPLLTRAYEQSPDEFRSLARRSVNPLLALCIPFALLFILRADAIMYALGLYQRGFAQVSILLQISGFGLLLRWASMYYGMLLICSDRVSRQARAAFYAAPFNLILTAVLILVTHRAWRNGAIGATIAAELTELLIVLIYARALGDSELIRANAAAVGRGLIAGIAPAVIMLAVPMPDRWAFVGVALLGIAVFFPVAVLVGAIRRDEVAPIVGLARSRFQRQA